MSRSVLRVALPIPPPRSTPRVASARVLQDWPRSFPTPGPSSGILLAKQAAGRSIQFTFARHIHTSPSPASRTRWSSRLGDHTPTTSLLIGSTSPIRHLSSGNGLPASLHARGFHATPRNQISPIPFLAGLLKVSIVPFASHVLLVHRADLTSASLTPRRALRSSSREWRPASG